MRWAWAEIDLDALGHNVRLARELVAPASVWVVVKADAYGHGARDVAPTALDAGAEGLCVALVDEGVELRDAGIGAPVLVLSEQPLDELPTMLEHHLTPTLYSDRWIDAAAAEAESAGTVWDVHVKIDTGMQRVGAATEEAGRLVRRVLDSPHLRLAGVYTHLARADEPHDPTTGDQLDRFDRVLASLDGESGLPGDVVIHTANSAGGLVHPRARRSLVRLGIATYGISPGDEVDAMAAGFRPVLSLRARVSYVKRVAAGSRVSYGHRHEFARDTTVATVPIGYADGVPRRLSATGGEVLVGGRRCPIVGVVTMDQLMVDVGDADVAIGDEVVLIGRQGDAEVRAEEWARRLDTIGYEVVCGVSRRVPRVPRRSIGA